MAFRGREVSYLACLRHTVAENQQNGHRKDALKAASSRVSLGSDIGKSACLVGEVRISAGNPYPSLRTIPAHLENDVRLRLTPSEDSYYDLFADSANNLVTASRLLVEIISDGSDREALAEKMRACEHAGDERTHAIMNRLNESFITPFDREDIYRLASNLDDVMDYMEAAADLIVLYQIDHLPKEVVRQVEVLERAAELTAEAMPRLRSMKNLNEYWIEINRLENQADQVYRRLLAKLFGGEYDALTVLKMKEVIDQLEMAADAFEHVANTIESIAVKES